MPYFLTSDTFADEPIWEVLAGGKTAVIDALQAAHQRLMSRASHTMTDGYLTQQVALRECRTRKVLTLLTTPVLGRPPRVHQRGDECECLGESWIEGYDFRIHRFLKRNPSKAEYKLDRAKKANLRDARLKALVHDRDGGCCRYCRSGPLSPKAGRAKDRRKFLQFDHVDPDQAATPDGEGLVVACGRCNESKGHRTPDEADMVLLPAPTEDERAAWQARGLMLFDPADQQPIIDEPASDQQHDQKPAADSIMDNDHDSDANHSNIGAAAVRPDTDNTDHDHRTAEPAEGPARVGQPLSHGSLPSQQDRPLPPRPSEAPDIYHQRSRHPASPAPMDDP
ncbi:hypothetical protein LWC34_38955 [Kibdelosporangium philippinense]|uniref:HNH endonuclease n=1 Tax=Kibdelosporangium philippinense TaxID=211113 RepID=A0ABS8ZM02_9PSEU|nr:hypothetical protein [Kibdelosporangium philippinense]MCE7008750.1 hypothetical protein [Kibdelosporangium philippinense]